MDLVLGIVLLVLAVFITVAVLLQSSKNHNLSGSIAGGAETFFGKQKGKTIDGILSKLTAIAAIIFAVIVIVLYGIQDNAVNVPENIVEEEVGTSEVENTEVENTEVENTEVENTEAENTEVENTEVENVETENVEAENTEAENVEAETVTE